MSDTPRTDFVIKRWPRESFDDMTALARTLERDLARLTEENEALRKNLRGIQYSDRGYCPACGGWDPKGNGCTTRQHTVDCWIAAAIDRERH